MAFSSRDFAWAWRTAAAPAPVGQLVCEFSVAENGAAPPPPALAAAIEAVWSQRQQGSSPPYNGLKFRLAGVSESGHTVTLRLGLTDYKSFLGTNYLPDAEWEKAAIAPADIPQHLAQPLGVEALVETSDGQFIFFRRSDAVAEYPGFHCGPGGHAEPLSALERAGVKCGKDASAAGVGRELEKAGAGAVLEEVVQSALDEISAEVGVQREALQIVGLCGVMVNTRTRGKPDLLFSVRCNQSAAEVQSGFDSGAAAEAFEVARLLFVPRADRQQLQELIDADKLTPASAALVSAYLAYPA